MMPSNLQAARAFALMAMLLSLTGCSNIGYYLQSINGHVGMLGAATPIADLINDTATPAPLRAQLVKAQAIRQFAADTLKLPDNASYRRYADLKRPAAVWNVVAAPVDSLQLQTWCFVVAGCVSYRGYYAQSEAQALADQLQSQGMEVSVQPVPAYSTLGKLDWLGAVGADPLLNTFIHYPEGELARLVFHELAHQVLYVPDDTVFNESFATAVERIGARLWLDQHGTPSARVAFDERDRRAAAFRALTASTRDRLKSLYQRNLKQNSTLVTVSIGLGATQIIANKQQIMQDMRTEYAQLKASWGGFSGYDGWMARANNATLGAQGAYDELVPQFEAVYAQQGQDWAKFYDAIKALVPLAKDARRAALANAANR